LTIKAFCEREGVSASNFHAWKRRFQQGVKSKNSSSRRKANGRKTDRELFVPVTVSGLPMAASAEVRIELPGGAVVRVPLEADDRVLARVIETVLRVCEEGQSC
jgi:hypothetical protein